MRRAGAALVAVAALVSLAACGSGTDGDGDGRAPDGDAAASGTSLTIEVVSGEGATPKTYRLTCDPAGGDHPQPEQACDAIAAAGASVFEPVPSDRSCTMVFGGPQTATVTGTYEGADVDASFSRQDGCEIDRWEKLGTTVFDLPLQ
ncbi:SSI family serine proteinase inhibitor [Aeromicrobium sp. Root472D3]|uniref:SSI family serine proteinase inhibitor n=1 Tax=Aeromicrobium sp. Root472D3 TaxID=1736540 RepID=UPI000B242ED7|nr:SSI family serine proteinase inhibitor [Aeromicrobium sp. Root472D3]